MEFPRQIRPFSGCAAPLKPMRAAVHSALIRSYTETQYQLRYGTSVPNGKMQEASDAVATKLLDDILGRNENGSKSWPKGNVPDIVRIGEADATAVGKVLFSSDQNDTAAELQQNTAWSGTLLFTLLRNDQSGRLLSTGAEGAMDTLNDLRDVLYAYKAYDTGFASAVGAAAQTVLFSQTGTPEQRAQAAQTLATDAAIFGQTGYGYLSSFSIPSAPWNLLRYSTNNATLLGAFQTIKTLGANTLLDMLRGAAQLASLGISTDLSAAQLDTPQGANARAALAALSIYSVQVSPEVAQTLTLLNSQTGSGLISKQWIDDRSAMLSHLKQKLSGPGGIVPGSQNLLYSDTASNTEVLVGAGSSLRTLVRFGAEGADALNGGAFADHLYGGAGSDTLDGLGGADYLEGGEGVDTYQFSGQFGKDRVVDTDGLGHLQIDGQTLGKANATGQRNTWTARLGDGQTVGLAVYDDSRSTVTGKTLVITRAGDTTNTITLGNFDLVKAQSSLGYIGIELEAKVQVALVQQNGGGNVFSTTGFDIATLAGQQTTLFEGAGKSFNIYLNTAAHAGDTLTLALDGQQGDTFNAILGDSTVHANGAVITLSEGQTHASFALVHVGELSQDANSNLSVRYSTSSSTPSSPSSYLTPHHTTAATTLNSSSRPSPLATALLGAQPGRARPRTPSGTASRLRPVTMASTRFSRCARLPVITPATCTTTMAIQPVASSSCASASTSPPHSLYVIHPDRPVARVRASSAMTAHPPAGLWPR
jgi:RTX calcium-binding nonapeptide repeat (4 copies)